MTIGKYKPVRRIDRAAVAPFAVAAGDGGAGVPQIAPPAHVVIAVPTNLVLSAALSFSAVTPSARINASWTGLESYDQERYVVQVSTDSGFDDNVTETFRTAVNQTSITIDNRRVDTTYYVRVAVVVGGTQGDWGDADSVATPNDTVAPSAPSGVTAAFVSGAGDLLITWSNPTETNFRDVEITIWESASKTTQYHRAYSATGRYTFTAAQNGAATSYAYDASLYIELRSRNWNEAYSSAVSASATLARPATPSGLATSWDSDAGTAGPDCTISWTAIAGLRYRLTIDGVARDVGASSRYSYTLDANRAEHSGTPDPVLTIALVAVDGLLQTSAAPATATATNAGPAAPTVTLIGGVSLLVAVVGGSKAADFDGYEYTWKLGGVTQGSAILSAASEQQYAVAANGSGSWTVAVRQRDAFNQYSSATVSSAVVVDAFTTDYLRALAKYSDDLGTVSATLDALKDGNLVSGGVTYSA